MTYLWSTCWRPAWMLAPEWLEACQASSRSGFAVALGHKTLKARVYWRRSDYGQWDEPWFEIDERLWAVP